MIQDLFRPGYADFSYNHNYEYRDYRGGGRAFVRETAVRMVVGSIACIL